MSWPPAPRTRALLALALAAFAIGTTEFVVVGLLPDIARDLHVTLARTGMLVTVYALGVTAGAPLMAIATARLERRRALIALMALFGCGNLLCAVAPDYGMLAAARVVTAFSHAAFFGIGAVVAAELGGARRQTQSVALMFAGLTVANIVGVPAATVMGQALGWRSAFWGVCAITLAAIAALCIWLPRAAPMPRARLGREFVAMLRPACLLAMLTSVLSSASLFALLTFITPLLERVTHLAHQSIGPVLLAVGVAMTVGNWLGGRLGDWRLMPTVIACFVLSLAAQCLVPFAAGHAAPMLILTMLWSLAVFTLGPPLQLRVLHAAAGAPNLASILNQGAFNLGNAAGAWTAATAVAAGWALTDTAWIAAGYAALGLLPSLWLWRK